MSYDIYLLDPVTKTPIEFDSKHHVVGGVFVLGGTSEAWLNITYNYGQIFREKLGDGGIRRIYGKPGAETIPILEDAVSKLADDVDPDYWKPTEGNAKRALCGLLAFAKMRPDGIWDGD